MYFHMGYTQLAPLACVFSVLRYIWGVGSLLLTRCIGGGVARAANSFTTPLPWQVVTGHTFPIACIATGKPTEHACDCVILTYTPTWLSVYVHIKYRSLMITMKDLWVIDVIASYKTSIICNFVDQMRAGGRDARYWRMRRCGWLPKASSMGQKVRVLPD